MPFRRPDPSGPSRKSDDRDEWLVADEHTKVEKWRLYVLTEAGYSLGLAQRIAMSAADLHVACEMLAQGCSPDKAAEILL